MAHRQSVTVLAPARLHMGFIDMSGALGRHFGSIGVALQEIYTQVTVSAASELQVNGPSSERATKTARRLCQEMNLPEALAIQVDAAIPEHIGLGSGTQMALAIGAALNAYYDLNLSVRDIARLADRGARSGIGIGVFEQGGLVVDGGRGPRTSTPPLLSRMPVPEEWRFILVFDDRGQGLHGAQEISAFSELPPFPRAEAERLCYLLLMQALPALAKSSAIISRRRRADGVSPAPEWSSSSAGSRAKARPAAARRHGDRRDSLSLRANLRRRALPRGRRKRRARWGWS